MRQLAIIGTVFICIILSSKTFAKSFFLNEALGGSIVAGDEISARLEAEASWKVACGHWIDSLKARFGASFINASCETPNYNPYKIQYWEDEGPYYRTNYRIPHQPDWIQQTATIGYQMSSFGLAEIGLKPDQVVAQYRQEVSGEAFTLGSTDDDAVMAYQSAQKSYSEACKTWKKNAQQRMGNRFMWAACVPDTSSGIPSSDDTKVKAASMGSVYYLQ